MSKSLFPGSFDPIHKGHLEIIKKAINLFDEVIVVVSINPEKKNSSPIEERFIKVKEFLKGINNVKVILNKNKMTAILAKEMDIKWIIRSGRNNTDFNYEIEIAAGNKGLNKNLETIMIFPNYEDVDYRSRLLKQKVDK